MRLFIAMPLSRDVEEYLGRIILDFKQKRGRVKWVASKNIHLTMKFLGETGEDKVNAISDIITHAAGKHKVIDSTIDRVGAFPNLKRPRVIWAGLKDNVESLAAVADDIESALEILGFEKENRKFKSHLTLGRVKDSSDLYELTDYLQKYQLVPQKISFDRLVLFKSTLTPRGPIYDRLLEKKLTA